MYTEEFIKHHGVKGQKWGVRKKVYSAGRKVSGYISDAASYTSKQIKTGAQKAGASISKAKANHAKKVAVKKETKALEKKASVKSIAKLSNADLREVQNRLAMQKSIRDMQSQIYRAEHPIQSMLMNDILKPSITNVGREVVTKQLRSALNQDGSKNKKQKPKQITTSKKTSKEKQEDAKKERRKSFFNKFKGDKKEQSSNNKTNVNLKDLKEPTMDLVDDLFGDMAKDAVKYISENQKVIDADYEETEL